MKKKKRQRQSRYSFYTEREGVVELVYLDTFVKMLRQAFFFLISLYICWL